MSASRLPKIKPVNPEFIPPEGSRAAGVTSDGHQLFELITKRSRSVPLLDEEGKQVWELHPVNGRPLYPRRKPEIYDHYELFYLESDGQANLTKIPYRHPTMEEIEAEKRRERIAAMKDALAEAFVDGGLTPQELVQRLKDGPVGDDSANEALEYPVRVKRGLYQLSDGSSFEGSQANAIEAEAGLASEENLVPEPIFDSEDGSEEL